MFRLNRQYAISCITLQHIMISMWVERGSFSLHTIFVKAPKEMKF